GFAAKPFIASRLIKKRLLAPALSLVLEQRKKRRSSLSATHPPIGSFINAGCARVTVRVTSNASSARPFADELPHGAPNASPESFGANAQWVHDKLQRHKSEHSQAILVKKLNRV